MSGTKDLKSDWTSPNFSFMLFQTIKTSQIQNGVRISDYERYRHYCSRRLRRLRKSLKFTYGRKKFQKKNIDPRSITDPRFLDLILFQAERSWSYAMDLKVDRENPRAKFHAIRRLLKASQYAEQLLQICLICTDGRSQVEAEIYATWLKAIFHLEKSQWTEAIPLFYKCRGAFVELMKYVSEEDQTLLRERLEDIQTAIKFCSHHIAKDTPEPHVDLSEMNEKLTYLKNVIPVKTETTNVVVDENIETRLKGVLKRANIEVSLKENHLEKRKLDDTSLVEIPNTIPIPCKPVLFDMALTYYSRPDLTEKKKEQKTSIFSFW